MQRFQPAADRCGDPRFAQLVLKHHKIGFCRFKTRPVLRDIQLGPVILFEINPCQHHARIFEIGTQLRQIHRCAEILADQLFTDL